MAHIPKEKRDKWDTKSKKLLFVGYDENVKGYRLMDPNTHKIINSRDIVFLENQFLNNINQKPNEKQLTVISDELEDDESLQLRSTEVVSDEDEEFHESTDRTVETEEVPVTKKGNESGLRRSNRK